MDPDYREPELLEPDAFCEYTMQQNSPATVAPSRPRLQLIHRFSSVETTLSRARERTKPRISRAKNEKFPKFHYNDIVVMEFWKLHLHTDLLPTCYGLIANVLAACQDC